jgi:NTP pyrophosphatase (non-canonical NTP hydrolase)
MKTITLEQYQEVALRTAKPLDFQMNLLHAGLGLTSEAGEVASAIKAHVIYGKELDVVNIIEEAGDTLWFLLLLCRTLGLSLEEIATANIAKLSRRYPDLKFVADHAINRDTAEEAKAVEQAVS